MKREIPLNPDSFDERKVKMADKNIKKSLKFSPEEYAVIRTKMEQSGMTFSKYVRTAALEGTIYKLETPEYRKVMTELHRVGNIFNQIARRLNETGSFYYDDLAEMKEENEELCRMLNQYLSTAHLNKL